MPEREDRDLWVADRRAALALRTWQGPGANGDPYRAAGGRARELATETRHRQFATLLLHSPDATIIVDGAGLVCEWNPAAEAMLGRQRAEVVGSPITAIVPDVDRAQFDAAWAEMASGKAPPASLTSWIRPDGSSVGITTNVASIRSGTDFAGAVAIIRGRPARRRSAGAADAVDAADAADAAARSAVGATSDAQIGRAMNSLAPHLGILERDELTGLPGRRHLQRRLAEPIPAGLTRGVAFLDADGFALVNEAYGPDAGDEVLQDLARRLVDAGGSGDLGRWQADAFVWVIDATDPVAALDGLTARASAALDAPFVLRGDQLWLTMSAGLVTSALAPDTDLLSAARDALRAAKDSGRDRVVWYLPAYRTSSGGTFRLANDLHRGIEKDELRLHFQPIIELSSGAVDGVEALVRWERPGVGLLGPVSFIEMAERTGQIVPLGAWVTRHACAAAAELNRRPDAPSRVSINLSARQLSDPDIVEMLRAAITDSGCAPSMLIVEVTETALTYDFGAAIETLETIKALGVGLDLDDFGTGYSSLLYLRHFPVDRIKIDRSFVAGLGVSSADTAIVVSTIALAHSIGLSAVAEGVENDEQLATLRDLGCDFAQGFLISRPVELDALTAWLDQHVPDRAGVRGTATDDGFVSQRGTTVRERAASARDDRADTRDGVADERDDVAAARDEVAAARDRAADERDLRADEREGTAGSALAPRSAQSGRARTSRERGVEATERAAAEHRRDGALADRDAADAERNTPPVAGT